MGQNPNLHKESPSQTAGPYVHIGCVPNFSGIRGVYPTDLGAKLVNAKTLGERITIHGRVIDGDGVPLNDAMVEIWQADANGLYPSPLETRGQADPNFSGWGRAPSDMVTGAFTFDTIRPGLVPYKDDVMNPHITFWIVARGISIGLQTRMYFPEDNPHEDPILSRIEDQSRVDTLIAEQLSEGVYQFDIHLQGAKETIFFDF